MLNIRRVQIILALLALAAFLLAACMGGQSAERNAPAATATADPNDPVSSDDPTPPAGPTKDPGEGEFEVGEALVDSVEILILESFPVQVRALVRGNLRDGCTELDEIRSQRQGNTFLVTITTRRPLGRMCTEALVPFEESIALDVHGLPAGKYTVVVNGVTAEFELAIDNAPVEDPATAGLPASCRPADASRAPFASLGDGYCLQYPAHFQAGDVIAPGPGGEQSMVVLNGPALDDSPDPVRAALSIVAQGPAEGRSLEEAVDQAAADFTGLPITRTATTLGGEPALIVEGLPGRTENRQLFAIHDGTVYRLILYPTGALFEEAAPDVAEVWQAVLESFTFLEE